MSLDIQEIKHITEVTRKRLGLTPSEAQNMVQGVIEQNGITDKKTLRTVLDQHEKVVGSSLPLLTGAQIRETRLFLGLTAEQFGPLLGFKASKSINSTMSALESGSISVSAATSMLARAYLWGYRSPNWPKRKPLRKPKH